LHLFPLVQLTAFVRTSQ